VGLKLYTAVRFKDVVYDESSLGVGRR
jgi:hypothetical protein